MSTNEHAIWLAAFLIIGIIIGIIIKAILDSQKSGNKHGCRNLDNAKDVRDAFNALKIESEKILSSIPKPPAHCNVTIEKNIEKIEHEARQMRNDIQAMNQDIMQLFEDYGKLVNNHHLIPPPNDRQIRMFCVEQAAVLRSHYDHIGQIAGEPERTIQYFYDFITKPDNSKISKEEVIKMIRRAGIVNEQLEKEINYNWVQIGQDILT